LKNLVTSSLAALTACACACISTLAAAAETQLSAAATTTTTTTASSETDAPGRSSVPAPAFSRPPVLERRTDFSPQNMAFELRFGPYAPRENDRLVQQDAGPGEASFFGDKTRYQFGFEVDGQLWRAPHVGTLGVGLGWSYTRRSAANKRPDDPATPTFDPETIGQKSSLNIMPMYAVGVLRVDVLAKELRIPLVGYGKFGLGYALWWVNDGIGTAKFCDETRVSCVAGRDTSVGTQAALGAMLLLDWLQPSSGAELDDAMGINNSYLFLEWSVSNFGGDQMNVGANTWVTGLAVEM